MYPRPGYHGTVLALAMNWSTVSQSTTRSSPSLEYRKNLRDTGSTTQRVRTRLACALFDYLLIIGHPGHSVNLFVAGVLTVVAWIILERCPFVLRNQFFTIFSLRLDMVETVNTSAITRSNFDSASPLNGINDKVLRSFNLSQCYGDCLWVN